MASVRTYREKRMAFEEAERCLASMIEALSASR
jgi:hypothetical protein